MIKPLLFVIMLVTYFGAAWVIVVAVDRHRRRAARSSLPASPPTGLGTHGAAGVPPRRTWKFSRWYSGTLLAGALALYVREPIPIPLAVLGVACGLGANYLRWPSGWPRYLGGLRMATTTDLAKAALLGIPLALSDGFMVGLQVVAFSLLGLSFRQVVAADSLDGRLQRAIEEDRTSEAIALVDQGADLSVEIVGITPIGWATLRGNLELVKHLLERGANIHDRTSEGDLVATAREGRKEAGAEQQARYDELIQYLRQQLSAAHWRR